MKRLLIAGLAATMLLGTAVTASADTTKTPDKSTYEAALEKLQNAGLEDVLSMTTDEQLKLYAEKVAKKAAEAANTEEGKKAAKTAKDAVDAAKEVATDAAKTGETNTDELLAQYYAKLAEKDKATADKAKEVVDKVKTEAEKTNPEEIAKAVAKYSVTIVPEAYSDSISKDFLNTLYSVTLASDASKVASYKDLAALDKFAKSLGFEKGDVAMDGLKILDYMTPGLFEVCIGFSDNGKAAKALDGATNVLEITDLISGSLVYQGLDLSKEQMLAVLTNLY